MMVDKVWILAFKLPPDDCIQVSTIQQVLEDILDRNNTRSRTKRKKERIEVTHKIERHKAMRVVDPKPNLV